PPDARTALLNTAPPDVRAEVASLLRADEGAQASATAAPGGAILRALLTHEGETLPPGTFVGAYRIEREIGRGGMGIVYRAQRADDAYQRAVAVKVTQCGLHAGIASRFFAERETLAALDHPNIARLLDAGTTTDQRPYFVMEYVAGEP